MKLPYPLSITINCNIYCTSQVEFLCDNFANKLYPAMHMWGVLFDTLFTTNGVGQVTIVAWRYVCVCAIYFSYDFTPPLKASTNIVALLTKQWCVCLAEEITVWFLHIKKAMLKHIHKASYQVITFRSNMDVHVTRCTWWWTTLLWPQSRSI